MSSEEIVDLDNLLNSIDIAIYKITGSVRVIVQGQSFSEWMENQNNLLNVSKESTTTTETNVT